MSLRSDSLDFDHEVSPVLQSLQDNFVCTNCGKCCRESGNPVLTRFDVLMLADFLGCSPDDRSRLPVAPLLGRPDLYGLVLTHPCFFFDIDNNACTVQGCKPQNCREWPFVALGRGTCDLDHVLACPAASDVLHDFLGAPCPRKARVSGPVPRCLHQRVDECTASVICVINQNADCPLAGKHDKSSCLGFVRVDPEQHPETGLP